MRIKWTAKNGENLPADLLEKTKYSKNDVYENYGNSYLVYAMEMHLGYIWYFVCEYESATYPFWYPSPLFTIEDAHISKYWVFSNNIADNSNFKNYVWAFSEWANDPYFYTNLVEDYYKELEIFRRYKDLMYLEFSDPKIELKASSLDDEWTMCPICVDAWKPHSKDGMIICPTCKNVMHNPFYESIKPLIID